MRIIITGGAGFIGSNLANKLSKAGNKVFCIDNLNNYYDVGLKKSRVKNFLDTEGIDFRKIDICDYHDLTSYFSEIQPNLVIHLAAQAGVRYSIENPKSYHDSNLLGLFNVLESTKNNKIKNLFFSSSSSVYGNSLDLPFKESHPIDNPESFYAATKIAGESMVRSYSKLFDINTVVLRFFTAYGPYGRPDMAYYSFTKKILDEDTIEIYSDGMLERDFTYIDDIVISIKKLIEKINDLENYHVFNIGNQRPEKVIDFLEILEKVIGKKANKKFIPFQKGDVQSTFSDSSKLEEFINFKPSIPLDVGLNKFYDWYKKYYKA